MSRPQHQLPATGLRGLRENWHNDVLAAFSVSMVALPLSLGIALASGAPAMSGLISALVAGFVTTFLRGSHVAINGPGNGLIAVIVMAMVSLNDGTGHTFRYILAAVVISGVLQVGIGFLKLGKLADIFPSSVIHGILAAIGLIILGKQVHVALGSTTQASDTLGILLTIPHSVLQINPSIALVSIVSLVILLVYPKFENKLIHFIPAPMWVLMVAIPLGLWLPSTTGQESFLFGSFYALDTSSFVHIPKSLFSNPLFPDFSRVGDPAFWSVVFTLTIISSIETLISVKAVDKLDPYRRETDGNKELVGVGVSTALSGLIGGLPVFTVIARSSVNVNNHAKTHWSNFFTGTFLLLFLLLLNPIIQMVPMAALAAILIYTGYKLTAPKVFKDAYKRGWEQLLFMLFTLGATLLTNLVWGLVLGTLFTYLFHNIRLGTEPTIFLRNLFRPNFAFQQEGMQYKMQPEGLLSFANILSLRKTMDTLPPKQSVEIDLAKAQLVDLTSLEYLQDFSEKYDRAGGKFSLIGLEFLQASSTHPSALHVYGLPAMLERKTTSRLSRRQRELKELAQANDWTYQHEINWDASYFQNFQFFERRLMEFKENVIYGSYEGHRVTWEIADLTFDEGALLVEEFHTTAQVLYLPKPLPEFIVERREFFDNLMELVRHDDLDYQYFTKFSKRFVVKGKSLKALEDFFTPNLINFFETHDIYHLECNGEALLLFRNFRLERPNGIVSMNQFSRELLEELDSSLTTQKNKGLKSTLLDEKTDENPDEGEEKSLELA
ncbi:MAG: SulP family inorganic anion transporter [Deltaproteobacteria bacterium]|nr:MAG: SulP family inorganic anion transporter [Deltaproteobacteria bacterium]